MEYRFSDLFTWSSGKPITPTNGDIPIYGSNGIIGYTEQKKYENKIILGRVGAYCGSVEYCSSAFNATDNTLITTCDTNKIIYKYAYYLLKEYRLNEFAGGSAQPLITQGYLKHLKCKIPTIGKQKQIASILSAYDDAIENNKKRIAILEKMASELYKEWFVRMRFPGYETAEYENGLPKRWKIKQLQELFYITIGRTPPREDADWYAIEEHNIPWLSIADMRRNGTFVTETKEVLSQKTVDKFRMSIAKAGTVMLSFKLSVGLVSIATENTVTNEAIASFNSNSYAINEYLYEYLTHFEYDTLGNTSAIGTAVNSKIVKRIKIILPERQLLDCFTEKVKSMFNETLQLKLKNQNLEKQRDLLLPRLMSGKLEV